MSFPPRKKPHFSTELSYQYVESKLLPTIEEAPSSPEALQSHLIERWVSLHGECHPNPQGNGPQARPHRFPQHFVSTLERLGCIFHQWHGEQAAQPAPKELQAVRESSVQTSWLNTMPEGMVRGMLQHFKYKSVPNQDSGRR
jgi:hypothetical protein